MVAIPVNETADGKAQCIRSTCYKDGIRNLVGNDVDRRTCVAMPIPVCVAQRGRYIKSGNRTVKSDGGTEQFFEARQDEKTNAITTVQKDNLIAEPIRVGEIGNGGQGTLVWQPKVEGAANHYLDCEVYCMAAADIKGVRNLFLQTKVEDEAPPAPKKEEPSSEEQWIRTNDNWI